MAAARTAGAPSRAGKPVGEQKRGAVRKAAPARKGTAGRPPERRGTPASGRITALFIGQGHGFIRLENGREAFFHRSDVREGISFNEFAVGHSVTFELLEDDVSGPRAAQVEPRRQSR
jgi:cold shock CspA family protein